MKKSFFIRLFLIMIVFILSLSIFGCQESSGRLYSFEEAYENGIINQEALFNIAYYSNREKNINDDYEFNIQEKNPKELAETTSRKIKKTYIKYLKENYSNPANPKLSKVNISDYYGTYNNAIAIFIYYHYLSDIYYYDGIYLIGGVKFDSYSPAIKIWCE